MSRTGARLLTPSRYPHTQHSQAVSLILQLFATCDTLLKIFMTAASADGCDFAAVMPRMHEVIAVLCNAIELLSSWEPARQVCSVDGFIFAGLIWYCRTIGQCNEKLQVRHFLSPNAELLA